MGKHDSGLNHSRLHLSLEAHFVANRLNYEAHYLPERLTSGIIRLRNEAIYLAGRKLARSSGR